MMGEEEKGAYEEALLRIRAAERDRGEGLRLFGLGLTALPPELGRLTNLRTLDVSENCLIALPSEIGGLKSLQALFLDDTGLTALPPEIGELANLRTLFVSGNDLTTIPHELGKLTNLEKLRLARNRLVALPPAIKGLTNLHSLILSHNRLATLPSEIGALTSLRTLDLSENRLTELPPEIGGLTSLRSLDLSENRLTTLPPEIRTLSNLRGLNIFRNGLTALPPGIGGLTALQTLDLTSNRLSALPPEIGGIPNLRDVWLQNNPLVTPPPEVVAEGIVAIRTYFAREKRRNWTSKLIVVGEGGVGKTHLLCELQGLAYTNLGATEGVEVRTLELEHPTEPGVSMMLRGWDFGGQEIQHATHQFFLTDRSLFLLVWDSRKGWEPCRLNYWLEMIEARAPKSPILIVATHSDKWPANYPHEELRKTFPWIVGRATVSCTTGDGIEDLRETIRRLAADLPLMGIEWPVAWGEVEADLAEMRNRKRIDSDTLRAVMSGRNVEAKEAESLGDILHALGSIVHYREKDELADEVILDPHWLTGAIARVLKSEGVERNDAIFTAAHRSEIWGEFNPGERKLFVKFMEAYDLTQPVDDVGGDRLVVQLLPYGGSVAWQELWKSYEGKPQIAMKYELRGRIPPGIPTWFIARTYRWRTAPPHQWRLGVLLCDEEGKHLGLAQSFPAEREIRLAVRGPRPANFFALLRDGLELTLRRFPGLKLNRKIPCPGHVGEPCEFEFDFDALENALDLGDYEEKCGKSRKTLHIPELLYGISQKTERDIEHKLDELLVTTVRIDDRIKQIEERVDDIALVQRGFLQEYRRDQEDQDARCPNVFALRTKSPGVVGVNFLDKWELQLYCQEPGRWHPTREGGCYEISDPKEWVREWAPYLAALTKAFKFVLPLAVPGAKMFLADDVEKLLAGDLKFMNELAKSLPAFDDPATHDSLLAGRYEGARCAEGYRLRGLREELERLDPRREWGKLKYMKTNEGHSLWLCPFHAARH